MEEKERYKYYTETNQIYDSEEDELYAYNLNNNKIISILNQQDKRIKELNTKLVEEMELSAERRQIIEDLTIENNQQDKEIEELKEKYNKLYECYKEQSQKDLKTIYEYVNENQQLKQSQNQKAIEELKKIKNYFLDTEDWLVDSCAIEEFIINQLKELEVQNEV